MFLPHVAPLRTTLRVTLPLLCALLNSLNAAGCHVLISMRLDAHGGSHFFSDLCQASIRNQKHKQISIKLHPSYVSLGCCCSFTNNLGGQAGAIYMGDQSLLTVTNSFFEGNSASQGGAIAVTGATRVQIEESEFYDNSAKNGGGVYMMGCGSSSVVGNYFEGNAASISGGALYQQNCTGNNVSPSPGCYSSSHPMTPSIF